MGAYAVVQNCVEKTPGEGGMAKELGECAPSISLVRPKANKCSGDGRLGIFVAKQTPNVRCYGSAAVVAIVNSCQSIMDRMDVSSEVKTFGKGGLGVDVELPYTWNSGEQSCSEGSTLPHR